MYALAQSAAKGESSRVDVKLAEEIFENSYFEYQYRLVEFMTEQLADMTREFGGDVHMAIILANVGQVTLQAAALCRQNASALEEVPAERRGLSTFRLADVTGIPRETVRRKLIAIAKLGWVERVDRYWILTTRGGEAQARQDLLPLDQRSLKRAARLYCRLDELVRASANGERSEAASAL